jgi:hypothetical protein
MKRTVAMIQHPLQAVEEERRYEPLPPGVRTKPKLVYFCKICRGIDTSCVICHAAQRIRNTFPELVIHSKFVLETWKKLRRFEMLTTGDDVMDHECHRMYGPWIRLTDEVYLLAVVSAFTKRYAVTANRALRIIEANYKLILAARWNGLNRVLHGFAMKEDIHERSNDGRANQGRKNR